MARAPEKEAIGAAGSSALPQSAPTAQRTMAMRRAQWEAMAACPGTVALPRERPAPGRRSLPLAVRIHPETFRGWIGPIPVVVGAEPEGVEEWRAKRYDS